MRDWVWEQQRSVSLFEQLYLSLVVRCHALLFIKHEYFILSGPLTGHRGHGHGKAIRDYRYNGQYNPMCDFQDFAYG